jgi:DNA-binding CsgD family transcriptional regulator
MNACTQLGNGLDIVEGTLRARTTGAAARLHRFIGNLLQPDCANVAPATLVLRDVAGALAWKLDGLSCGNALRSLHSAAAALVLITDIRRILRLDCRALQEAFELTPVECALAAALVVGKSLQQAALSLRISEGHARQRLQSIFQKTSTSRQGELIALLNKLV